MPSAAVGDILTVVEEYPDVLLKSTLLGYDVVPPRTILSWKNVTVRGKPLVIEYKPKRQVLEATALARLAPFTVAVTEVLEAVAVISNQVQLFALSLNN